MSLVTETISSDIAMRLKWIYGYPDPPRCTSQKRDDLRNLATHRIVGDRFQGKSALGEFIMAKYLKYGSTCYDFFAANDNESLAALDKLCPFRKQVVLVHGDSVKLHCNYPTIKMAELDPRIEAGNQLFITCKKFYGNEKEHYEALARFTKLVQLRDVWDRVDVLFIREAQQYISSRMKTNQARTQKEAAEDFIEFHNEAFHSGMSVIIDSQREVEVSKNLRELATFTYYKNMGSMEIPRKIWWIASPKTANFKLDDLRSMKKNQFLLMTNQNSVAMGQFEKPPWHISRGAGLLRQLGISVLNLEGKEIEPELGVGIDRRTIAENTGRPSKLSPEDEESIRKMRIEGKTSGQMYEFFFAKGLKVSQRTIREHVHLQERKENALNIRTS